MGAGRPWPPLNYPFNIDWKLGAIPSFIPDKANSVIREISPSGIITTVGGTGTPGYSGDGGPAILAQMNSPEGMTHDPAGNIYFYDDLNYVLRKIDTNGIITTVGGGGAAVVEGGARDPADHPARHPLDGLLRGKPLSGGFGLRDPRDQLLRDHQSGRPRMEHRPRVRQFREPLFRFHPQHG